MGETTVLIISVFGMFQMSLLTVDSWDLTVIDTIVLATLMSLQACAREIP